MITSRARVYVMKSETRFLFFLFAVAVVGFLVQYGLNVYLARHLSAEIYGDYTIAIKSLGILVSLALFGTDMGSQCFLSKYLRAHQAISAEHYIAWNIKLISISFLFARLLALISFTVMIGLHFFGVKDIHQYPMVIFVLWVTPFAAAFQLLSNFLLSEE